MKRSVQRLPAILMMFSFAVVAPSFSEPPNLSLVKKEIMTYHDSGQYQHDITQKIEQVRDYIIQQALANQKSKEPKKLALILDIDETSLSNYNYMVKRNFEGSNIQIHKEILAGDAPAIKPTLALYQTALKQGINVFFITGRRESEREATKSNLIKEGYTKWSGLHLRPNEYSHSTIIPFKSETRALITKQGYTIIASVGDQYSDLRGGYTKKGFKLPNPFYHLS